MSYTPGPWQVGCRYGWLKSEIATPNYSRIVATVWTKKYEGRKLVAWEEGEANARLIAAAPELLGACKEVLGMIQQREKEKGYADSYDVAAAAWLKSVIQKAEEVYL